MPTSNQVYVALGDSISIDDYAGGPGCGAASLLHKNLPRFAEFQGSDLSTRFPGIGIELLAADGAKAPDVVGTQLYHLGRVEGEIIVATVTCGGNDLLGLYGADLQVGEVAAQDLRHYLDEILADVRDAAGPDCLLVVGNIYDPTDGTGDPDLFGGVEWPDGLSILDHFNEAIEDMAQDYDAVIVDVHAHFLGHGCAASDLDNPHHNPDDPTFWYEQVIEPNARGASEVRRLFWERVEEHFAS